MTGRKRTRTTEEPIAPSLREVNQSPWLLFTTAVGGVIKFYDPSEGKFYFDEIEDLRGTQVQCSKDGWVLYTGWDHHLYNPFSGKMLDVPHHGMLSPSFALSCAPTSPDCVVFAIETDAQFMEGLDTLGVSIGICHPGDKQWTKFKFRISDVGFFNWGEGPVFCNGLFYCMSKSSYDLLGVFDPKKHTWNILDVPPPNLARRSYDDDERANHLVEFKGEILLICVSYPKKPVIFKLDLSKMKWVKMKSLNGLTVFVSSRSSLAVTNVPKVSSNSIYFSKHSNYGKNNYLYSLDDCKYHPAIQKHEGPFFHSAIWIQPPKGSHLMFDELY